MTKHELNAPNRLTLEGCIKSTLSSLCSFYLKSCPEKVQADFEDGILGPMLSHENPSGDNIRDELLDLKNSGSPTNFQFAPMIIACTYCAQSIKELQNGNRETAWSCLADARYWCGATNAGMGIEDARVNTIVSTRKNTSQKGNAAKGLKRQKMLDETLRLAKENLPPKKGWHSRPQVARSIRAALEVYALSIGIVLSEKRAVKTICDWLDDVAHLAPFLPPKQIKKRAPK